MTDDLHDPFERLLHTHRRIEERLEELLAAAPRADPASDEVVKDVLGFFARAGQKHVDDEERTLFPRLRALPALAPILAALEEEHREHARLERALEEAAPGNRAAAARALADAYRAHIEREERTLFPAARAALTPEVLRALGEEMAERRGGGGDRRRA